VTSTPDSPLKQHRRAVRPSTDIFVGSPSGENCIFNIENESEVHTTWRTPDSRSMNYVALEQLPGPVYATGDAVSGIAMSSAPVTSENA